MSETIVSKNNPHIKELGALRKKGGELFLVEGFHLVEMAYKAGALVEVLCLKEQGYKGIKTVLTSKEIIGKLASSISPEPIIGVCKKIERKIDNPTRVLLLDRVQDPGNVGTLLRTALAFGFDEVLSIKGSASFYNQKAIASSQGAIFSLALKEGLSEEEALSHIKDKGLYLLGSALEGGVDFHSLSYPSSLCLALGNEGKGMSETLKKASGALAYIPISGIDSLNVASAGAIMMESINHLVPKR
jgi:RNA methyltransferase, TrmH family